MKQLNKPKGRVCSLDQSREPCSVPCAALSPPFPAFCLRSGWALLGPAPGRGSTGPPGVLGDTGSSSHRVKCEITPRTVPRASFHCCSNRGKARPLWCPKSKQQNDVRRLASCPSLWSFSTPGRAAGVPPSHPIFRHEQDGSGWARDASCTLTKRRPRATRSVPPPPAPHGQKAA